MQFSANETVQAICRTLFHSLWQGLLLAIAGGIVVLVTKKLRAAVRYNILTTLLVVFAAGVACTFCYQLSSVASKPIATETINVNTTVFTGDFNASPSPEIVTNKPVSVSAAVINWLTANAGVIVFAWLLIVAFRCVQMAIGLRGIYILRHKGVTDAGEYWVNRLKQLSRGIQLAKPVRLMQSAIAKVPMVTGHLKPVILLPLGVLTALPQDEIEAILLHELAHIRRKDYLVNMLQNLCEIIFFFNPAVLWISSLIKEERENCCDDIAINEVKNKKQFIHALISFQEYNLAASNYAVGFPGRRNHLLNRVKRIVTNNNKTLNNMEKTLLATGIVILSFITIAFAHAKQTHTPAKKPATGQNTPAGEVKNNTAVDNSATDSIMPPEKMDSPPQDTLVTKSPEDDQDTTKAKKQSLTFSNYNSDSGPDGNHFSVTTTCEGHEYRIKGDDDTITSLCVDDEKIPADKIAQYQPIIDKIREQMAEQRKQFAIQQEQFRKQQEGFRQQQEQFRKEQEQFRHQQDTLRNGEFRQQQEEFRRQEEQFRKQQDSLRVKTSRMQEEFRQQQEQFRKQQDTLRNGAFRQQQEQFRLQQEQFRRQQEEFREQQRKFREENKWNRDSDGVFIMAPIAPAAPMAPMTPMAPSAPMAPMSPLAPSAALTPMVPMPPMAPMAPMAPMTPMAPMPPAPFSNKTIKAIVNELKNENIITSTDDLSFKLSKNGLTVNGESQPEALFERFKNEYLKGSNGHIIYESTEHGHHIHSDVATD